MKNGKRKRETRLRRKEGVVVRAKDPDRMEKGDLKIHLHHQYLSVNTGK